MTGPEGSELIGGGYPSGTKDADRVASSPAALRPSKTQPETVTKDWWGLREILDSLYPVDIFPPQADREESPDGVRILSLARYLSAAEERAAAAEQSKVRFLAAFHDAVADLDALQAKVNRIEQFVEEMRSVDTPLTQSVARLVEGALNEGATINCPDCGHWAGRHDPDSGHCDTRV